MAENIRQFVMQNNALRLELDFDRQDVIRSFTNRGSEALCNCGRPLFFLRIYDTLYSNADFVLQSVSVCEDRTEQLLTAHYTREEDCLAVKIHFINDRRETIRVLYQVYDGYRYGVPYVSFLRIPLLSELELDGEGDTLMAPGCQFRSEQGKKIIMPLRDYQYSSDIRPPLVLLGKDRRHGFSVTFPVFSDLGSPGPNQNQNKILTERESAQSIREDEIFIAPDASFNDTVELMITGLCRGWAEAFDRYRDFWSAKYDFSEYRREDLQWFYNTAIHNFVFFYGGDGFDRRTMKIDVDGLLRQGEEFGGYDTVTLWKQYPSTSARSGTSMTISPAAEPPCARQSISSTKEASTCSCRIFRGIRAEQKRRSRWATNLQDSWRTRMRMAISSIPCAIFRTPSAKSATTLSPACCCKRSSIRPRTTPSSF